MQSHRLATCALLLSLVGCEEEKKPGGGAPSAAPAASPAPAAPAAPTAAAKPKPAEPLKVTDLELTDARRSKIEQAIPDAKGFAEAKDFENELQKKKLKDDDEKLALKTFDTSAKGKWLLFRGNITTMKPDSFELAVTFKPMAPGDPMGLSRKFFMISFRDVKGYKDDLYTGGQFVVVLAKYAGDKHASPGYDLHALGDW